MRLVNSDDVKKAICGVTNNSLGHTVTSIQKRLIYEIELLPSATGSQIKMTNQEKFISVFGIDAWQQMAVFGGVAEQFKEFWTSPYSEV